MTRQEFEGRLQIEKALEDKGMDIKTFEDIDNLDPDEDEEIQEGEEIIQYPDMPNDLSNDPMDLAKNFFIEKHQEGY